MRVFSIALLVFVCIGSWFFGAMYLNAPTKQTLSGNTVAQCAAIESGKFEDMSLPITCTLHIHKDETAEFTFQIDGGLLVQRNGKTLLTLSSKDDPLDTHTAQLAYLFDKPTLRSDGFILKDITFDGYADLQVMTFAGAYNFGYDFYAYNPKTRSFGPDPILEDIVNPNIDTEKKEITYFHKGRGLADMFSAGTYQFKGGVYVLTETVEQDMVTGHDDPDPIYERVTSKLQNGKMVVVEKETLTAKDVWGE